MNILKSRGLILPDEQKVHRYLLTNNYFNIINGYSKYFQISSPENKDKYIYNSNFDEVSSLYFFDKELKQTFFNAILHCEHHLKSIFAYRFAEAYPEKKYAYFDINNYDPKYRFQALKTISRISKLIDDKIKYKDDVILHYHKKYDDVPVWVLVDFLDFGVLVSLIKYMPKPIQNKIAQDLNSFINDNLDIQNTSSPFTPEILNSFIKNIHETRNICAHNNRLLDFNCRSDSLYFKPLYDKHNISSTNLRRSPYTTMLSLQCFLSKTEYAILSNTIRKRIKNLSKQLNSIEINVITSTLGFPSEWEQLQTLSQN